VEVYNPGFDDSTDYINSACFAHDRFSEKFQHVGQSANHVLDPIWSRRHGNGLGIVRAFDNYHSAWVLQGILILLS